MYHVSAQGVDERMINVIIINIRLAQKSISWIYFEGQFLYSIIMEVTTCVQYKAGPEIHILDLF